MERLQYRCIDGKQLPLPAHLAPLPAGLFLQEACGFNWLEEPQEVDDERPRDDSEGERT